MRKRNLRTWGAPGALAEQLVEPAVVLQQARVDLVVKTLLDGQVAELDEEVGLHEQQVAFPELRSPKEGCTGAQRGVR